MMVFEHCTLEWYWAPAAWQSAEEFQPSFVIFHPGGQQERRPGYSAEVTVALTQLGQQGWEAVACVTAANWLLWTLKRRIA